MTGHWGCIFKQATSKKYANYLRKPSGNAARSPVNEADLASLGSCQIPDNANASPVHVFRLVVL